MNGERGVRFVFILDKRVRKVEVFFRREDFREGIEEGFKVWREVIRSWVWEVILRRSFIRGRVSAMVLRAAEGSSRTDFWVLGLEDDDEEGGRGRLEKDIVGDESVSTCRGALEIQGRWDSRGIGRL